MRIGYLDLVSGVSGDMWVGALLDLGVPLPPLVDAVASLRLPGVGIRSERVLRQGLAGTRFVVEKDGREPGRALDEAVPAAGGFAAAPAPARLLAGGGHAHGPQRGLREIEAILVHAVLPEAVKASCRQVFAKIAAVEAKAHASTPEQVHFHEVGAEDTIVDVVCACLGTHLLGLERLYASAVTVGTGTVRAAHGRLPVPAPATFELLVGVPVRQGGLRGERTTPTGAALLRTLVHEFDPEFVWVPERCGYGAGTRDEPEIPNLLRLAIGEQRLAGAATTVVELQCQVDTATGEALGWLLETLRQRGALDAFATPIQMKKSRPGVLLTVLADPVSAAALTTLLLEEATSLGVRSQRVQRAVLERWQETRTTVLGPVVFKVARLPSGTVVARPEDDEITRLCAAMGLGRGEVRRRLLGDP
ncbi:MAG: nickel pincer cofactor biosynthesis protein LarC [Planctomycetes bacterium]|nr:nickel pincer cofactor biosynthesis protein LarC [Planctomycetota bacterium]